MTEYKGFQIVSDGSFGMVSVKPVGKGSAPKELRGTFTSGGLAQKAIDAVVSAKAKK